VLALTSRYSLLTEVDAKGWLMVLGMPEYEQAFADTGFVFVHQLYELTKDKFRKRINIATYLTCVFGCSKVMSGRRWSSSP
jgi:hypothetical protein